MENSTKVRVAAIVGSVVNGRKVQSVFNLHDKSFRSTSAIVESGRINGYDFSTSSCFSGEGLGDDLYFFDEETSSHVYLKLRDKKFNGYDYYSASYFSGSANGPFITVRDETSREYSHFRV